MVNENGEGSVSIGSVVAAVPIGATFLSIVYIYGYSISASLPVLSLMSIEDFAAAALPWLIPATIVALFSGMVGGALARAGVLLRLVDPVTNGQWYRRVLSSVSFTMLVVGLTIIAVELISVGRLRASSLILLTAAVYLGFIEFTMHTKFTMNFLTYFGNKNTRYILMLPLALAWASFAGYDDGVHGRRAFRGEGTYDIELVGHSEAVEARISFRAGRFVLIHRKVDDAYRAEMIPIESIRRLRPTEREATGNSFGPAISDSSRRTNFAVEAADSLSDQ